MDCLTCESETAGGGGSAAGDARKQVSDTIACESSNEKRCGGPVKEWKVERRC